MIKVLIVEDDKDLVRLTRLIVEKAFDATVDVEHNGQSGYNKATNNYYDVILCDIQMPIIDGLTMMNMLRESENTVLAIAITGYGDKKECLDAGFDDYINKPYSKEDLVNKITEWLPISVLT